MKVSDHGRVQYAAASGMRSGMSTAARREQHVTTKLRRYFRCELFSWQRSHAVTSWYQQRPHGSSLRSIRRGTLNFCLLHSAHVAEHPSMEPSLTLIQFAYRFSLKRLIFSGFFAK